MHQKTLLRFELSVILRAACEKDLDALLEIEQRCFDGDRLSRRSFRNFIRGTNAFIVVAERAAIIGYGLLLKRSNSRTARIYSLAVLPQDHCQGVAKKLLQRCEDYALDAGCERIILEVRKDNTAAIRLYEHQGYRWFGRRRDYYEDGEDALRFEKKPAAGGG